jgi:uncharacterized protein (DUF488 family)
MRIYSVGHGARSLEDFARVLEAASIRRLVDVRSFPGSRRHPQFGKEALAAALPGLGIAYRWEPRLGGRRRASPTPTLHPAWQVDAFRHYADYMGTPPFAAGLQSLLADAADEPTAYMCAETHWSQCHRRIISDQLWALRHDVVHLLSPERQEPHHPPPFLRILPGAQLRYDLPVDEHGQVRLL